MKADRFVMMSCALTVLAGCGPDIAGFSPNDVQRGRICKVEGDRMTGANLEINGTLVAAAFVPWSSDPLRRKDIVIPVNAAPAPATEITIKASDLAGSDSRNATVDANPPYMAVPPAPSIVSAAAIRNFLTNEVVVTVTGSHIFPGAGPGTGPFDGPSAKIGATNASSSTFQSEGVYTFVFPSSLAAGPGMMTITNDAFYGGVTSPAFSVMVP